MKKIYTISLLVLFLTVFVSCTNKQTAKEPTTSEIVTGTAFLNDSETEVVTSTENSTESSNPEQTNITLTEHTATETMSSDDHNENAAPQILFLTLADIAEVETACNNMDEDEFMLFISKHPKHYEANGINSRSEAKKIINELKETTIFLLDNDVNNVSEMYFYLERNEIQQPVFIENDKKIICTYYTPQNNKKTNSSLDNNPNAEFIEEITVNEIPIKMYKIKDNPSYFAELIVNNTSIFCRITDMENVDELKTCLNRITFVKINDLINQ